MSVTNQTPIGAATGNGVTTVFPFTYYVAAASDIVVKVDGVTKVLGIDYTVTGAGNLNGGDITMTVAPTVGARVAHYRNTTLTRSTDYQDSGDLLADVLNLDFDRLWLALQEIFNGGKGAPTAVRVPAGETIAELPAAASRANRLLGFGPSGELLPYVPTAGDASALAIDLASTATGKGAALVGFLQSGTGATARTALAKLRDTINARDFGATGSGSDETAKVQLALNALPSGGGEIVVPAGVKFNIKSLTFPAKSNLIYRADDDLSTPGPGFDIGSGEWVNFSVNSSYPAQPTGGAVNEWRFSAPFHPALVVDARKDVTGGNSGLGTGQTLNEPVRASYNLLDEQTDAGRLVYENYLSGSNFSMMKLHAWRRVVTLNGIGTAQWTSVPAEGVVVTGTTSGAKGFVLSVAAGATTLLWFSGKFVAGETVSDNNETTSATISSVAFSLTSMAPLSQGLKRGNWAIGLPADAVRDAFVVGGKIGTQKDRSPTYYVDEAITAPGFVWVDSYENTTPNGFEVVYDTVPAAASRRLTLRKYNETADRGHVGAVAGHCTVTDPGTPVFRAGGFNFATVVRGGSTGRYDFTFTTALATANYRVMLSSQFTGHLSFDLKSASGFSVFAFNAAGTAQWAPFDFDVVVIGGDI